MSTVCLIKIQQHNHAHSCQPTWVLFAFIQDLEEQLEEEVTTRQRLMLEKVTMETKVKSLETDLLTTVEQRDRLVRVSTTKALVFGRWCS